MTIASTPTTNPAEVAVLERTKLVVDSAGITKRHSTGIAGQHSFAVIEELRLTKRTDRFGVFFTVLVSAAALASRLLIPNPTWNWALTILLSGTALLLLTAVRTTALTVVTKHGTVHYNVSDPEDLAYAFLLTAKELQSLSSSNNAKREPQAPQIGGA